MSPAEYGFLPAALDTERAAYYLSVSPSTIEALERAGEFVPRVKISARRTGFLREALDGWLKTRPPSDLLPPPNTGAKKPRREGAAA